MGLFDTLWELGDIAKDIIALPFEIGKAATELGQDIKETVVQDIQHKIERTPDKPIRTSYTIKEEAETLIAKCQDEYQDARNKFNVQWDRMAAKSEKLLKDRADTYALIGQAIRTEQLAVLPSGSTFSSSLPAMPSIDSLKFDLGTYTGSISMRMDAAEDFLSRAKEYRIAVKSKITEINQLKRLVMRVSAYQKEELEMLSIIRKSYQSQNETTLLESAKLLRELAGLCLGEVCEQTNTNYGQLLQKLNTLWS